MVHRKNKYKHSVKIASIYSNFQKKKTEFCRKLVLRKNLRFPYNFETYTEYFVLLTPSLLSKYRLDSLSYLLENIPK